MSWELDTSNLEHALLYVERATGRAMDVSMKRAGLHTIIGSGSYPGAMQLTPKATRGDIDSVSNRQLEAFEVRKAKARGDWPISHFAIQKRAQIERQRRQRSVGYAAYAGWNNAAKAMGGKGIKPSAITDQFSKSEAAAGRGTISFGRNDILIVLTNTAPAIERIGVEALQEAIDNAAHDLTDYADRKLGKIFNEVNAH